MDFFESIACDKRFSLIFKYSKYGHPDKNNRKTGGTVSKK